MEYETWGLLSTLLHVPSSFLSYFFFLISFRLARAWIDQPRLHLLQHLCEPVTDETAKTNALNSPVLPRVCQALQWLIKVYVALELLQLPL